MMDNQAQIRRQPVIRVFVSSTFTDLKHERDALQRDVFPRLEQLCASRQFQFQAIDLRWGVPTEASLDHRTMRICFEELRRSQEISPQPNFLILLGNRYGWRPLPEEISEDEFRRLEQAASLGLGAEVLRAWYQRDENAVPPVYLLQPRKKNQNDGRDYTNDQVWNEAQRILWDVINRAYRAVQLAGRFDHVAALDEPLPSIVRFQASATEQEIWRGALGAPNARQHVFALVRDIENVKEFQPVEIRDFVDVDESGAINAVALDALRELKQELRERLGEGNVIGIENARFVPTTSEKGKPSVDVTTDHLEELCARVHAALKDIITRQMDEYWGTSDHAVVSPRELELERSEHQRFGEERAPANSFVGRERHLQAIHAYLHNDSNEPLVIHGASGCGKTALLARAAQDFAAEWKPVLRFISVTRRSSDIRSLLASLCQELRQRHPLKGPIPSDVRELTKELNEHFKSAAAQAPLILVLDALDQLAEADNGPSLFWIPFGQLPSHVKLIVSCLSNRAAEGPASQPYTALKRRGLPEENFINLDALSEDEAQTLFFERWLPQTARRLNAEQAQCIRKRLTSEACRQPLYLKVLFEEARLWRSAGPAPTLGNNVSELIGAVFTRLGNPFNHGPTLECALGYIAAARHGLTESEILEVLYRDPDYTKFLEQMTARTGHQLPDNPKRIPVAIWSRLRFDLSPYLTEHAAPGGTVLNFYHRQVGEFVRGQYLDTPLKRQKRHDRLARYFDGQDYFLESQKEQQVRAKRLPPTPRPANVRKVDELPWQRLEAAKLSGEWDTVEKFFTDLFFLEAKAEAGMVFDLAGDFGEATNSMPPERLKHRMMKLLEEAIRRDIHFIAHYPTTLFQCLWNTCWWLDCLEAPAHYAETNERSDTEPPLGMVPGDRLSSLLYEWCRTKEMAISGYPWLRSMRPPPQHLGTAHKAIIRGHDGPVTSVAISPDGKRVVSGSDDHTVRVWDALSGAELHCLRGHDRDVTSVAFAPDGQCVASGSADYTVRLWDANTGAELGCFRGHKSCVECVAFTPDGQRLASGSEDDTVRVWDADSGAELRCLRGHEHDVTCVAFAPDGKRLVSGSRDHTVRVWDARSGTELRCLRGHEDIVFGVAFAPDSQRVASGSADDTVRLWDSDTGAELRCLRGHEDYVLSVAFSPVGKLLVSGSFDHMVRLWDADTGAELRCLHGHEGFVYSAVFALDGQRVASSSGDKTVRLWDVDTGTELRYLRGHERSVSNKKRLPDGPRLASGVDIRTVAFSPDGERLASGGEDKTVRVWDADTGVELRCLRGHEDTVTSVAFSPDGQRLASGSTDNTVRLWDASSGTELLCLCVDYCARSVAFSPDGQRLASGSGGFWVHLWDVGSGTELRRLCGHKNSVECVAFSPDAQRLASGSVDKTVRLWVAGSGAEFRCLRGHWDTVTSVIFSPDGKRLVSGSLDNTVRVWDVASGTCLEVIQGRRDVSAIAGGVARFPWLALARGLLTEIEVAATKKPIAWFPMALEYIATHPSGRTWAGAAGNHLHLFRLEATRDA